MPRTRLHIVAQMEIDTYRGVIYVHDAKGRTRLRICQIPMQLLDWKTNGGLIDIVAREEIVERTNP
jgi:hypothetical protein